MGNCLRAQLIDDGLHVRETPSPLTFHPYVKGQQIELDESLCEARRSSTFHDGLVFTNRPLQVAEVLSLKITGVEKRWEGSLRVGLTTWDPLEMEPLNLPPFLCPDLCRLHGFWGKALPDRSGVEGTQVQLWFEKSGWVWYKINQEKPAPLFKERIPICCPLWAVMDVYGTAKTVQLLDMTQSIQPSEEALTSSQSGGFALTPTACALPACPAPCSEGELETCVVCFSSELNAIISPCGHACVCYSCSKKVLKISAKCPICRQKMAAVLQISPHIERAGVSQHPS